MKKFALWVVLALLIPLQASAASKWQEGKHYEELDKPLSDSPQVVEFFSYWCPHCYRTEPFVADLKKSLDKGVKFEKVHVNFMAYASQQVQDEVTTGMLIAKALKQEDKLGGAIFNYIHKQRATITGLKDVRNIFIINGVEPEQFDKLAKSFGVKSMLRKNNKTVEDYRREVRSVPTFIVNGKYKVQFTRDTTPTERLELINYLAAKRD
ncbi:thiol:disulfide interchange protein DsbA/DsbL [Alteromonas lipolytica]|uniref:Thiol:disulfide interchange protein n=1 Tax=Alteromonas lipolytica TaxID=1856405 RepID=A0A1E8FCQ1_9ALTE|nr:thiol:disulfide interchange protein DsbA/DsbL [Alteromonas lipolytica]OFI33702.1 disulfide bond formation protein DsbA [Alteromonas lipolytica]GGF69212.1 thiol:disulfide interchange protein [Alteromonas lipolytica]